jgi:hypothetical protein
MKPTQRRPATLAQLLAILFALVPAIAVVTLVLGPGGGHPTLGGVLLIAAAVPTLAAYLSRALEGSDFPSALFLVLAALEYPLVGYGVGSLVARVRSSSGGLLGIVLLVAYVAAHLGAHVVLNQQAVNLRLLANPNPGVSRAAVARLAASGDGGAVPGLQDRFMQAFERYGNADETLIQTLTQLGGARGWQDLLESGRLGVRENEARMWRSVIRNVHDMADPEYAVMHGADKTAYLGDEDIARLSAALASRLAEALRVTPDSDASLTLIAVMNGRRDLCAKYFALVPNGLRDQPNRDRTNLELARVLAAIKQGQSPDATNVFLGSLAQEDVVRLEQEPAVVADEWASWAASEAAPCRMP